MEQVSKKKPFFNKLNVIDPNHKKATLKKIIDDMLGRDPITLSTTNIN